MRAMALVLTHGMLVLGLLAGPGCSHAPVRAVCDTNSGPEPDFGGFGPVPMIRIGGLPFPGLLSLYAEADPERLGAHVYHAGVPLESADETKRGLLYTCRAGFLDLAHIRNTIDNAAHIYARLRYALRRGNGCVRFRVAEPSIYTVEILYPATWWALDEQSRMDRADELAIRAAESLAVHTMTWHEVLTWYGYKVAVIIPEKHSAFTYEDTMSHAVGATVAGRALRAMRSKAASRLPGGQEGTDSDASAFGAAVTVALSETLNKLGVLCIAHFREAVQAVRGEWWSGMAVTRRAVHEGPGGEQMEPWLVPGFRPCAGADAELFAFSSLARLDDDAPTPTLRVLIEPRFGQSPRMLRDLAAARGVSEKPGRVDLEADLPLLLDWIRAHYIDMYGEGALRP